jgi:hypothetical protein
MANLNPKYKRIPPRAEELVRYINDVMVFDFAANRNTGAVIDLPDIVAFAHMVTNEVGTIPVQDFGLDVMFVPKQ